MSETPAPCWVSFLAPYFSPEKGAWIAAVIWRNTLTDREILAESGAFEAYRHALQASRFLAASRDLFEQLVAANPPDMRKAEPGRSGQTKNVQETPFVLKTEIRRIRAPGRGSRSR